MIGEAYRRFLWNTVTIKRGASPQSDTGVTKFVYTTLFTNVACNVQDGGGGRMSQEEFGQKSGHKHKLTFGGEWSGKFQTNDLVVFTSGVTMRIVDVYEASYYSEYQHHVTADAETYVPAGDV